MGCGQLAVISQNLWNDWEKPRITSVRIVNLPAETLTGWLKWSEWEKSPERIKIWHNLNWQFQPWLYIYIHTRTHTQYIHGNTELICNINIYKHTLRFWNLLAPILLRIKFALVFYLVVFPGKYPTLLSVQTEKTFVPQFPVFLWVHQYNAISTFSSYKIASLFCGSFVVATKNMKEILQYCHNRNNSLHYRGRFF